mmetsp:Transcript_2413/g.5615  ORF Transcript_2413/g.5615 Transcript_2413/m.5615 type:complete len:223 (+) Transcript_2413:577-1245(+)
MKLQAPCASLFSRGLPGIEVQFLVVISRCGICCTAEGVTSCAAALKEAHGEIVGEANAREENMLEHLEFLAVTEAHELSRCVTGRRSSPDARSLINCRPDSRRRTDAWSLSRGRSRALIASTSAGSIDEGGWVVLVRDWYPDAVVGGIEGAIERSTCCSTRSSRPSFTGLRTCNHRGNFVRSLDVGTLRSHASAGSQVVSSWRRRYAFSYALSSTEFRRTNR